MTYDDAISWQKELEDDPHIRRPLREIIDATRVERIELSGRGIWDIVQRGVHETPGSRIAVVVASEVIFGLARMFEQMHSLRGITVQVFRDMAEAERWIDKQP